ncbi:plasmid partitioning protein RepB C-terminal domain-containing protein [Devosia rhizoryzae]|uniref:RepB plasmid partition n=1 Tax=Devosia rhizoryzae TaxID=2774137 RepID=A0ABX7C454_9HYPH|nr:plasmid partitioning protein RepB C-terminal domain-containing protein [Devosia rhizoryzae]QQR39020.1 RepB plasmid partition [Devosia rhizoryzae]
MTAGSGKAVKLAFEASGIHLNLTQIVPLKTMRPGTKESKKYAQILRSVKAIGLVEAPVVSRDPSNPGKFFLLDGMLRIEALKDLGIDQVECLIATDDETYTYNKRINRLVPVQEHNMVVNAIKRGVPEAQIAEALGLEVTSVRRRARMLDGICPEAVQLLTNAPCPFRVFDILRQMTSIRQIEAAELMLGQQNFTAVFARALLVATSENQLVPEARTKPQEPQSAKEQIARLERELVSLQSQIKSVEDDYGIDNLHLTVAKGYVAKLLGNARVVRWLAQNRHEYLGELQNVAEIETVGTAAIAAE